MKYILDTDILIYLLKGNENVITHISQVAADTLHTTIINHTELLFGAFNSNKKKQNLEIVQTLLARIKVLPFCEKASYVFAEQKALLKNDGNIIADMDLMIASISLHHHMTLVTNNMKHFSRIVHLKLENWSENLKG